MSRSCRSATAHSWRTLSGPASVRKLCAVAERHDLLIISDEIYRDLTHAAAAPFLSPAEVAPERTVITAGLSKNLALGGWRLGVARLPGGAHRLRAVRRGLKRQQAVGGKAGGPIRQALKRDYEETGDEEHQKAEGRLNADESAHETAA